MAITVIGHVTRDTLIFPQKKWHIVENLGGTLYTVSALASLADETINLICNVGDDIFSSVISSLDKFSNVDISGIKKVVGSHFHCYILFASEYGTQYDEGIEVPIEFSQILPFLSESDFILISPMTGFDIKLETLQQVKQAATCPIYLDYHILALDRDVLGNRFLRRRDNWLDWCISCDHLQLNQFEAESLSEFPITSLDDAKRFSKNILQNGVKSVAITCGSKGAFVCLKEDDLLIHGEKVTAVDTTGCGDVFASAFVVRYLETQDYRKSYEFANKAASLKCSISGFNGLADTLLNLGVSNDPK